MIPLTQNLNKTARFLSRPIQKPNRIENLFIKNSNRTKTQHFEFTD